MRSPFSLNGYSSEFILCLLIVYSNTYNMSALLVCARILMRQSSILFSSGIHAIAVFPQNGVVYVYLFFTNVIFLCQQSLNTKTHQTKPSTVLLQPVHIKTFVSVGRQILCCLLYVPVLHGNTVWHNMPETLTQLWSVFRAWRIILCCLSFDRHAKMMIITL